MLKILCIGDIHIQPTTLADVSVFLVQLEKYLSKVQLDLIVILGDTLHSHETVYTECLNKMLEYIKVCERYARTEILVGNHDYINNTQFLSSAHPFKGWEKNIVDFVKVITLKGKKLVLVPYVPDGRFMEALNTNEDWKGASCIFAHQLFDGVKLGPIPTQGIEKWDESYPLIVSGHIHDKQRIQENLWYAGSAMQISFGERSDHTLTLVEIGDDETPRITEIDIQPPRKKVLHLEIRDVDDFKEFSETNVSLKLSLTGSPEEFKTFKKTTRYTQLVKKGIKVVFKASSRASAKRDSGSSRAELQTFPDILYEMINSSSTNLKERIKMVEIFHKVVNQKTSREPEIVFE